MDRTQLLQCFETLAETPEAVEKLRKLALQLAVRGKLTQQNSDEERTKEWREFATKFPPADADELDYDQPAYRIPKSWRWVRLNDVADYSAADKVEPSGIKDADWVLDLEEVEKDTSRILSFAEFKEKQSSSTKAKFRAGDVLYGKLRPYLNKVVVAPKAGFCTTEIVPIRTRGFVEPAYLCVFLRSPDFVSYANSKSYGMKMPRLGTNDAERAWVAIPPPAEQQRIVAKVEELLALCDELAARQTTAHEHRARLVHSALDHLTTVKDETQFRKHAHFILHQSPFILENVPALRQAIVQLAVRGRLTQQVNSERVASTTEENGIGASLTNEEPNRQAIPSNWLWLRFRDVLTLKHGHQFREFDFVPSGIPVIKIGQCKKDGRLDLCGCDYIAANRLDEFKDFRIEKDDILMALTGGTLGKVTVINRDYGPVVQNYRVGKFVPRERLYTKGFTEVVLLSGFFQTLVFEAVNQNAQPNIGKEKMEELVVPVPPLAEQYRIVTKVEELMRWFDQLEEHLTTARTTASHLLDATIQQILAA